MVVHSECEEFEGIWQDLAFKKSSYTKLFKRFHLRSPRETQVVRGVLNFERQGVVSASSPFSVWKPWRLTCSEVYTYFGSISRSHYTLFQTTLGGVSWYEAISLRCMVFEIAEGSEAHAAVQETKQALRLLQMA